MMDKSVRSNTIEWLRFFCSASVVFIHSIGLPLRGKEIISYQNGVYDTIRIFFSQGVCRAVVPIFFIISGYLFFIRLENWNTKIWREKLKSRIRTLLVPYLLWNLISICVSLLKVVFLSSGEDVNIVSWFNSIGGLRAFFDSGTGGSPNNYPLWFIRDLMVFCVISPLIFYLVKNTRVLGLALLYIAYLFGFLPKCPGFSTEGLFFFGLGAYFSINKLDFVEFFKRYWVWPLCISIPIVFVMVITYGNNDLIWNYSWRLYTLFGASCMIGIAAVLIEQRRMGVNHMLANSSFFIYAAHGTIVLPAVQHVLADILPYSQFWLIVGYFAAPLLTISILALTYYCLSRWTPKILSVLNGGRIEARFK